MSEPRDRTSKRARAAGERALAEPEASRPAPPAPLNAAHVRLLSESTPVSAIMTRQVTVLAPEASVGAVTELFLERDVSAAPVVDADWLPLAIVSKTDLLRFWLDRTPRAHALGRGLHGTPSPSTQVRGQISPDGEPTQVRLGKDALPAQASCAQDVSAIEATPVAEVTVPYVLSLHEEAPICVAAALMAYENVHRLPIVSTRGDVVGVVSTLDVVRWLAESTGMGAGE